MESDLDKSAILICFVVYADSATPKPVSKIKQLIIHVLYFQEFKNAIPRGINSFNEGLKLRIDIRLVSCPHLLSS
jgi:hypothetical protein